MLLYMMKMLEHITFFQFLWFVIFMKTESKTPLKQGFVANPRVLLCFYRAFAYYATSWGCVGPMEPGEEAGLLLVGVWRGHGTGRTNFV